MHNAIWKFIIPNHAGTHDIYAPAGARPLSIGVTSDGLCCWMRVDTNEERRTKVPLTVCTTGGEMPNAALFGRFLGTAIFRDGHYVAHVFAEA